MSSSKYLKYKLKYLQLLNQHGSADEKQPTNPPRTIPDLPENLLALINSNLSATDINAFSVTERRNLDLKHSGSHIKVPSHIDDNNLHLILRQATPDLVRSIDLSECKITDIGLQQLAIFRNLNDLNLTGCNLVTSVGVNYLTRCPNLITLNLSRTSIDNVALVHLNNFEQLHTLNLSGTQVSDAGLANLRSENLEYLNLRDCSLNGEGIQHLQHLPRLTHLNISMSEIEDNGLDNLDELKHLIYLDLSQNGMLTDNNYDQLGFLDNLQYLDLSRTNINDDNMDVLSELIDLKVLKLSRCSFRGEALENISELYALEHLDLSHCENISDEDMEHLHGLVNLRTLNLTGCDVTAVGLAFFRTNFPNLVIIP